MTATEDFDRLLPLTRARLSRVVDLGIDIPMRYAECYLVLDDGTRVRLRDRSQLLGWTGPEHRRRFFFQAGRQILRIDTNALRRDRIQSIETIAPMASCFATTPMDPSVDALRRPGSDGQLNKITAPDGRLMFLASETKTETAAEPAAVDMAIQPA